LQWTFKDENSDQRCWKILHGGSENHALQVDDLDEGEKFSNELLYLLPIISYAQDQLGNFGNEINGLFKGSENLQWVDGLILRSSNPTTNGTMTLPSQFIRIGTWTIPHPSEVEGLVRGIQHIDCQYSEQMIHACDEVEILGRRNKAYSICIV
jgi:hypothetical protein